MLKRMTAFFSAAGLALALTAAPLMANDDAQKSADKKATAGKAEAEKKSDQKKKSTDKTSSSSAGSTQKGKEKAPSK